MLRMRFWLFGALLSSGFAAACSDNCMKVQEQICLCQGQTQSEQSTCQSNASTQEGNNNPNSAQLAFCAQILDQCTALINNGAGCHKLQTNEGRIACGLQSLPDGGL